VEAPDFEAAGAQAERLAEAIDREDRQDRLAPVYESLDLAIADLTRKGYQPSDLLPAGAEPGLGFSLNEKRDGKTLWQAIAISGRASLCAPDGDLSKRLVGAGKTSTGALVTAIMAALGLPAIAVAIAISLAGVILAIGLPAFCDWTAGEPDEPAKP
jgi:hypothetical protein